jgi:hypothetical protein
MPARERFPECPQNDRNRWEGDRPMTTMQIDEVVRGRMAGAGTPSGAVHPSGRICADDACTTVLSVYNPTGWCWQHERPHPYVLQAPRKRRKDAQVAEPEYRDFRE